MIYDNLTNIYEDMLEILDESLENHDKELEEPIIVTWDYLGVPYKFTLLIHNQLPIEVDFHESEIVH